jgi:heme-degrading monooxygenase HmoA
MVVAIGTRERRRSAMHARVSILTGSPDQTEQGIATFKDNVVPAVKELGGHGALLLVDRDSGKGISITLWNDEASMRASEERANELRRAAAAEFGSTDEPVVERYEVAVFEKS